jgi:hypothetical protein
MTFVTTSLAIAGLAAVSIPILIHLLSRQRRRPVQWAAMRFLMEAFRKQRRRLQVQQLLLLAVRCLIVLLLGAALARPLLQQTGLLDPGGGRVVYLVVDNGMISQLEETAGQSALAQHQAAGERIIESLAPGDRVGIITAARPAQNLLLPPTSDHAAAVRLLRSIQASDAPTDLSQSFNILHTSLTTSEQRGQGQQFAYLLSDFRQGSAPLDAPLPSVLRELDESITLVAASPAEQPVDNVLISSIDPVRNVIVPGAADGSGQVTVRLQRAGGELAADVSRVRLVSDALAPVEPRIIRWEPGQSQASVDFLLNLADQRDAQISLTVMLDDDALNADNARHAVLDVRSRLRLVLLDRRSFGFESRLDRLNAGQWMRRALNPLESGPLEFVEVEPAAVSLADVRSADVIIATRPDLLGDDGWALLRGFVDRGGLLVISPPAQLNVHQWTERLASTLGLPWRVSLETEEVDEGVLLADEQPRSELLRLIASDLDELARPVATQRFLAVDMQQSQATVLLQFANSLPMVLAGSPRATDEQAQHTQGLVVLFTTAPELAWTNLPSKPLMVPLMHEIVRQGLSSIRANQQFITGQQPSLAMYGSATDIISPEGETIALSQGRPSRALDKAGIYQLRDGASQSLASVPLNIDPSAGQSDAQPANAVMAWLAGSGSWNFYEREDPAALLRDVASTSPLAGVLLLIVLLLVVLETMLARWFSYSYEGQGAVAASGLKPTIQQPRSMMVESAGGAA